VLKACTRARMMRRDGVGRATVPSLSTHLQRRAALNVSYVVSLRTAWQRMVRVLFRPFSLSKWFVLGFAAFLSEGLRHGGGGRTSFRRHAGGMPDVTHVLERFAEFLRHPVWGAMVLAVLTLACIVFLVLVWVNSRARFIFLDDVVHERAAIVEPWHRFARRGNELFIFMAVSLLLWVTVLMATILPVLPGLLAAVATERWRDLLFLAVGGWLVFFAPLALAMATFYLFLSSFVVPLMYRHDIGPLAAWRRFGELFARHPVHFLGFALLYLVLSVAVFAAALTVGLGTCCIGFFLMATPYVGSVVMLPVEVFLRGLGPDFLAQFGPEYSVFTAPTPGSAS
jgi:hypothetical protein